MQSWNEAERLRLIVQARQRLEGKPDEWAPPPLFYQRGVPNRLDKHNTHECGERCNYCSEEGSEAWERKRGPLYRSGRFWKDLDNETRAVVGALLVIVIWAGVSNE